MRQRLSVGFSWVVLLVLIAVAGLASGLAYIIYTGQYFTWSDLANAVTSHLPLTTQGTVDAPGPLRGPLNVRLGKLTPAGIISQTNLQRQHEGLAPLKNNEMLNQAAQKKLADMFQKQYFEHVSPQGVGPAELVTSVGYTYIRVGENLALGSFKDDPDVVQAWMNSPGHRANILRPNVTEIGVAAATGTFEGKTVWIAVQEFGLPASQCPTPDPAPQKNFDTLQAQAITQNKSLLSEQSQIHQEQIDLNQLAATIDQLAKEGNEEIDQGNTEMKTGNEFAQEGDQEAAQGHWTTGEQLQTSGTAKVKEAQTKQASWNTQNTAFQQMQTSYNQKVDIYKQLEANLKSLEEPINTAIESYNTCITK